MAPASNPLPNHGVIENSFDLEVINEYLSDPVYLGRHNHDNPSARFSPSQLPSQAASSNGTTPTQADHPPAGSQSTADSNVSTLEYQLQGFTVTHYDANTTYEVKHLKGISEEVNIASIDAWKAFEMSVERGYLSFDQGHSDVVLAVDFHYYGYRMVTASSDHKLKVWDRKDDNWTLVDSWKAHDAEIVDVSDHSVCTLSSDSLLLFYQTPWETSQCKPHEQLANAH
jgi:nucleoporin SEH1